MDSLNKYISPAFFLRFFLRCSYALVSHNVGKSSCRISTQHGTATWRSCSRPKPVGKRAWKASLTLGRTDTHHSGTNTRQSCLSGKAGRWTRKQGASERNSFLSHDDLSFVTQSSSKKDHCATPSRQVQVMSIQWPHQTTHILAKKDTWTRGEHFWEVWEWMYRRGLQPFVSLPCLRLEAFCHDPDSFHFAQRKLSIFKRKLHHRIRVLKKEKKTSLVSHM